jgi:hypothetical protein
MKGLKYRNIVKQKIKRVRNIEKGKRRKYRRKAKVSI